MDSEKPLQTMIDKVLSETASECCCDCSQKDAPALDPKEAMRQQLDSVQVYRSHRDSQSASQKNELAITNFDLADRKHPLSCQERDDTNDSSSKDDDFANNVRNGMPAVPTIVEISSSDVSFHEESNKNDNCLLNKVSTLCRVGSSLENSLKTKLIHQNVAEKSIPSEMSTPSPMDANPLSDKCLCPVTSEHAKTPFLSAMSSGRESNLTINRTRASLRSFQASRNQSEESNSNEKSYLQISSKTLPTDERNNPSSFESESTSPPTGTSSLGLQHLVLPIAQLDKTEAFQSVGDDRSESTHDQNVPRFSETQNCESGERAKNILKSISISDISESDCANTLKCIPNPERCNVPSAYEDTQRPSPPLDDEDQQYHECSDVDHTDVNKIPAQTGSVCSAHSCCDNFSAMCDQDIDSRSHQELLDTCGRSTEDACHCNSEAKHLASAALTCEPVSYTSFFRLPAMTDDHRSCSSRFQLYQFELRFPAVDGCQSVRWRRVMRRMRKLPTVISIDAEEENNKLIVILHVTLPVAITGQDRRESPPIVGDKVLLPDAGVNKTLGNLQAEDELAAMRQDDCQQDGGKSCLYVQNKAVLLSGQVAEFNDLNLDSKCTAPQARNGEQADQQTLSEQDETGTVMHTRKFCEIEGETKVQYPGQELIGYGMEKETAMEPSRFNGNGAAESNVMCLYTTEDNVGLDARTLSRNSSSIHDDVNCWDDEDFNFDDEVYCKASVQSEDSFFCKLNLPKNGKEEVVDEPTANWYEPIDLNVLDNSSAQVFTKKNHKKAPFNAIFRLLKKIDKNVSLEATFEVQLHDGEYNEERPASCCEQETDWARHRMQDRCSDLVGANELIGLMDRDNEEKPNLMSPEKQEAQDKEYHGNASSRLDEIKFALPKDSGDGVMCLCDCDECMEDDFKDNPGDKTRCFCEPTLSDYLVDDGMSADLMESAPVRESMKKVADSKVNIQGNEYNLTGVEGEEANGMEWKEESKNPRTSGMTRKLDRGKMCWKAKACASAHCIYKKKNIFDYIGMMDIMPLLWCSEGHRVLIKGPVPEDKNFSVEFDQEIKGLSENDINTTSCGKQAKKRRTKKDIASTVNTGKIKAKKGDSSKVLKKVQTEISLPKDNKDKRKKCTKRCSKVPSIKKQIIPKTLVKKNLAQMKGKGDLVKRRRNESINLKKRVGANSKRAEEKKAQNQRRQTKKSLASEGAPSQKKRPAKGSRLFEHSTSTPGKVSLECTSDVNSSREAVVEPTACSLDFENSPKVASTSVIGTLRPDDSTYVRPSNGNPCDDPIPDALDSEECSLATVALGGCKDKAGQSDLEDLDALPSLEDEPDQFSMMLGLAKESEKSSSFAATTLNEHGNITIAVHNAVELLRPAPTLDAINEFPLLKQSRVFSPLKQSLRAVVLQEQVNVQVSNKQAPIKVKAKLTKKTSTTSTFIRSRRKNMKILLPQNKLPDNLDANHVSSDPQVSTNSKQLDCTESSIMNCPLAGNKIEEQSLVSSVALPHTACADDRARGQQTIVSSGPESVREFHGESPLNDEYLELSSAEDGLSKDYPTNCNGGSDDNQGIAARCLLNENCTTELEIYQSDSAVEVVKNISVNNRSCFHENQTNTVNKKVPSRIGRSKGKAARRSEKSSSDNSDYIPDDTSKESGDEDSPVDTYSIQPRDLEITSAQVADYPEHGKTRQRQVRALKTDFAYHFDDEYNQMEHNSFDSDANFVPSTERAKPGSSSTRGISSKDRGSLSGQRRTKKKKKFAHLNAGRNKEINLDEHFLDDFRNKELSEDLHLQGLTARAVDSTRDGVTKRKCGVHMTARKRTKVRRSGKRPRDLDKILNQTNFSGSCFKRTSVAKDIVSERSEPNLLVSCTQSIDSHTLPSDNRHNQLTSMSLANVEIEEISNHKFKHLSMIDGRTNFGVGRVQEETTLSSDASVLDRRYISCFNDRGQAFTKKTSDNTGNRLLSNDSKYFSDLPSVAKLVGTQPSGSFKSEQSDKINQDGSYLVVGSQQERCITNKFDVTPAKEVAGTTKIPAVSMIKRELTDRKDIIGDISDIIDIDSSSNSSSNSNDWNMKSGTTFSDVYFKFISETSEDTRKKNDGKEDTVDVAAPLGHRGREDASAPSVTAMVSVQQASVMAGVSVQETAVTAGLCETLSPVTAEVFAVEASVTGDVGAPEKKFGACEERCAVSASVTDRVSAVEASVTAAVGVSEDTTGVCEERDLQDPLSLADEQWVIDVDDSDDEFLSRPISEEAKSNSPKKLSVVDCIRSSFPNEQTFAKIAGPGDKEFTGFSLVGTVHPLLISLNSNHCSQRGIGSTLAAKHQSSFPPGDTANHASPTFNSLYSTSVRPGINGRQFAPSSDLACYRSTLPRSRASLPKPIVLQSGLARAQRKEARKTYDQITCVRLFEADSDASSVGSVVHKACKKNLVTPKSGRKRGRPRLSSDIGKSNWSPKLVKSPANIRLKEARVNVELWTKAHVDKIISEECSSSSSDEYLQRKSFNSTNDPKLKVNARLIVERVDLASVKRKYGVTLSDYYLQPLVKKSKEDCNADGDGCLLCSDVCCCVATSATLEQRLLLCSDVEDISSCIETSNPV